MWAVKDGDINGKLPEARFYTLFKKVHTFDIVLKVILPITP